MSSKKQLSLAHEADKSGQESLRGRLEGSAFVKLMVALEKSTSLQANSLSLEFTTSQQSPTYIRGPQTLQSYRRLQQTEKSQNGAYLKDNLPQWKLVLDQQMEGELILAALGQLNYLRDRGVMAREVEEGGDKAEEGEEDEEETQMAMEERTDNRLNPRTRMQTAEGADEEARI